LLHGSPGLADWFPTLVHVPAYTSGELAAIFTQRAHNAGGRAIVFNARPLRLPDVQPGALRE
jgi:hypothetical protein